MFNFKKIASVAVSTLMTGATVALAAAANYPAPFVQGGVANVAIVTGEFATADAAASTALSSDLSAAFVAQGGTTSTGTTITGENYELFTGSSPLLLNSSLNAVRQTLSSGHLPTVLKDGSFETTTNIDYTQRIELGPKPFLEFKAQPTSSFDPQLGFSMDTSPTANYVYNATVSFASDVNFTHADSEGETIELFGKKYTVGGATTSTKLILLRSSQTASLSNVAKSTSVTVDGKAYTVELVSASDADARIKVTDSGGISDEKTIAEDASKTIRSIEIGVTYADEKGDGSYQASLIIGASRITLQDGSAVKFGTEEDTIDGTQVEFYQNNGSALTGPVSGLGKMTVAVAAKNSDNDVITPGLTLIDPVWESFKIQFTGINIPRTSEDRELIEIKNSGSDKMQVKFLSHDGTEAKTINWVYNATTSQGLNLTASGSEQGGGAITGVGAGSVADLADNDGKRIIVTEMGAANRSEYVVLPNTKQEGGLYKVASVYNATTGYVDDYVELKNEFTGKTEKYYATGHGTITGVTLQGKTYTITYSGDAASSSDARQIRVDYDESSTTTQAIVFPTIGTDKGAKVMFYEPTFINLLNWDNTGFAGTTTGNLSSISIDDGDGYTSITVAKSKPGVFGDASYNFTFGSGSTVTINTSVQATSGANMTGGSIGLLTFNITGAAINGTALLRLARPDTGALINTPAIVLFEEKDDASNYQATVFTMDAGYDGSDGGIGVGEGIRTWSGDTSNEEVQLEVNDKLYEEMDIWGTIVTLDKSDSDQVTAKVSYPDDQVIAMIYAAESEATSSGNTGALGNIVVSDSQVSTVAAKNLIVLGGSCVNTAARKLIDSTATSPICGSGWTDKTGAGSGEFLIKSYDSPWSAGKVALLVAGWETEDTSNAANALKGQKPDVAVGMSYKGSTATSLTPIVA